MYGKVFLKNTKRDQMNDNGYGTSEAEEEKGQIIQMCRGGIKAKNILLGWCSISLQSSQCPITLHFVTETYLNISRER